MNFCFIRSVRHLRAFTMTELTIVILAMVILAMLFVPRFLQAKAKSARIACVGRLKQIGLAHKVFANDLTNPVTRLGDFTMQLSTNHGGTLEFVGTGKVAAHYQNMVTEVGSPKILVCPDDKDRIMRSDFLPPFNNCNVSYAIGVDASVFLPNTILASDNHMTSSLPRKGSIIELSASNLVSWTRQMHAGAGNICLSDGSVLQVNNSNLWHQVSLAIASAPTNRLEFP